MADDRKGQTMKGIPVDLTLKVSFPAELVFSFLKSESKALE
jgi:hypothetical protein